jgi:hypothetical protein
VIGVNHIDAHIYANFIDTTPTYPFISLIVSGGHTRLVLVRSFLDHVLLGDTRDDASGEAFDKTAKILGLPYPGGPLIDKYATEGDTPAFMHVYPNGLNDPDQIDQGGWGGRFSFDKKEGIRSMSEVAKIREDAEKQYDPYFMFGNTSEGVKAISRWSEGYNNDFAARMDWSITENYEDANHHPIALLNGDKTRQVLHTSVKENSVIELSAVGSTDPDGDKLNYSWSFYAGASSYEGKVDIQGSSSEKIKLKIPHDAKGKTIHIILEINDNGIPNLYAYRRMILNVQS